MNQDSNKTPPLKVTAVVDAELLGSIEQHRRHLIERTGLQVSTSAAAAQLMRAGLAAANKPQTDTRT